MRFAREHPPGDVPMLRDNEVLKKMIATGEERMSKIASQLLCINVFSRSFALAPKKGSE